VGQVGRLVDVSGRRSGPRPPLLIFPAIYGVNPELEPRGNELTRLVDVPLVPMECPAKDRYRIMIKCPVSAITSAWFCCSHGFPQIGAEAEISTPTLVVSVVLPAARRPVCKPEPPGDSGAAVGDLLSSVVRS
jgi:hypothetical protein